MERLSGLKTYGSYLFGRLLSMAIVLDVDFHGSRV